MSSPDAIQARTDSPASASDPLLTASRIVMLWCWFIGAVACLYGLGHLASSVLSASHASVGAFGPLGISRYFPLSYFRPRIPGAWEIGIAIVCALIVCIAIIPRLSTAPLRHRRTLTFVAGLAAILATTATQGYVRGFVYPVAGREPHAGGQQYWHDAEQRRIVSCANAAWFMRRFNAIQPTLHEHARTHPPGAVLVYAVLHGLTGNRPAIASVIIATIASLLSAYGIAIWSSASQKGSASPDPEGADKGPFAHSDPSASLLLLLLLMPAAQVYFCATLDSIVAGLLLVAIAACKRAAGGRDLLLAAAALTAASFLTFGWVWAVPVLLAAEMGGRIKNRPQSLAAVGFPWKSIAVLLSIAAFYGAMFVAFRFDYIAAFHLASRLENPNGFRLLADPAAYLATRLEDIGEIAVFCGPLVLWLLPKGFARLRASDPHAFAVCAVAVATLLGLFLTGAFRTGETARACLFIFPFLLLPVAAAPLNGRDRHTLCQWVFAQSLVMQCFGFYFW